MLLKITFSIYFALRMILFHGHIVLIFVCIDDAFLLINRSFSFCFLTFQHYDLVKNAHSILTNQTFLTCLLRYFAVFSLLRISPCFIVQPHSTCNSILILACSLLVFVYAASSA